MKLHDLSEYIRSSFRLINASAIENVGDSRGRYDTLHEIITTDLPQFLSRVLSGVASTPLELELVYAFNKRSQITTIGNRNIVIHNQYLGRTFNNLNKILMFARNGGPARNYLLRLVSEELYAVGCDDSAAFVNELRKRIYAPDANEFWKLIDLEVSTLTLLQELFILVHEVMHLCLNRSNDREQVLSAASARIAAYSDSLGAPAAREEMANWIETFRDEIGMSPDEMHDFLDFDAQLLQRSLTHLEPEVDPEEFAVDELALRFLMGVVREGAPFLMLRSPVPLAVVRAASDAIRHMRVLAFLSDNVNPLAEPSPTAEGVSRAFVRATVRWTSLRLAASLALVPHASLVPNDWWRTQRDCAARYRELIDDPMMYGFERKGEFLQLSKMLKIDLLRDDVELMDP